MKCTKDENLCKIFLICISEGVNRSEKFFHLTMHNAWIVWEFMSISWCSEHFMISIIAFMMTRFIQKSKIFSLRNVDWCINSIGQRAKYNSISVEKHINPIFLSSKSCQSNFNWHKKLFSVRKISQTTFFFMNRSSFWAGRKKCFNMKNFLTSPPTFHSINISIFSNQSLTSSRSSPLLPAMFSFCSSLPSSIPHYKIHLWKCKRRRDTWNFPLCHRRKVCSMNIIDYQKLKFPFLICMLSGKRFTNMEREKMNQNST